MILLATTPKENGRQNCCSNLKIFIGNTNGNLLTGILINSLKCLYFQVYYCKIWARLLEKRPLSLPHLYLDIN